MGSNPFVHRQVRPVSQTIGYKDIAKFNKLGRNHRRHYVQLHALLSISCKAISRYATPHRFREVFGTKVLEIRDRRSTL